MTLGTMQALDAVTTCSILQYRQLMIAGTRCILQHTLRTRIRTSADAQLPSLSAQSVVHHCYIMQLLGLCTFILPLPVIWSAWQCVLTASVSFKPSSSITCKSRSTWPHTTALALHHTSNNVSRSRAGYGSLSKQTATNSAL